MYWVNFLLFFGYTSFWFSFIDNPLEIFIKNSVFSYRNLSSEEFAVALRFAFMFFLVNVLIKIRAGYKSFKNLIINDKPVNDKPVNDKPADEISLTKTEEDRYKIDFIIDKKHGSIFIQKSTEYDNIEGVFTDDFYSCVTSEVKPFLTFKGDVVRPRDINKMYNREDTVLTITYKDKEKRTVITNETVYKEDYDSEENTHDTHETQESAL